MSDFFAPPPPPPPAEHVRHRQPEWAGPPHGVLPGIVALELVLARSAAAAVCVARLSVYPTGVTFDLITMAAREDDDELDPMLFGPVRHRRRRGSEGGLPEEMLRFGVEFSDGRRATNTAGRHPPPGGDRPEGPLLHPGGGSGGGGQWRQDMFLWPLPPPGPLALVCEWPAAGIALTRHEIDTAAIREAAARAQVIFAGEPGEAPRASLSSAVAQSITRHGS